MDKRLLIVALLLSAAFAGDEYDIYNQSQNNQTLMGSSEVLTIAVNTSASAVISEARLNWNGTDYAGFAETGTSPYNFSRALTIPDSGVNAANISYYWNFTVSYTNGTTLFDNNTVSNQSVYRVSITNCTVLTTEKAVNLSFFDEDSLSAIKAQGEIETVCEKYGQSRTTSWSWTANQTAYMCVYPAWADCVVNATIEYTNTSNYVFRDYVRQNVSVSNTSSAWSLFLLNRTLATNVTITIEDTSAQPQSGVVVGLYRKYLSDGQTRLVTSSETDSLGQVRLPVKFYDTSYQVILSRDGETLQTFDKLIFTTSAITLIETPEDYGQWWDTYQYSMASCAAINSSNSIQCNVTNPAGVLVSANLSVFKLNYTHNTTVGGCGSLVASSFPATIQCNLGDSTNKTYYYVLMGKLTESDVLLASGMVETISNNYGTAGLIFSSLIIGFCVTLAAPNPAVIAIMSVVGLGVSWFMGFLSITATVLMSAVVVAIILALRVNT